MIRSIVDGCGPTCAISRLIQVDGAIQILDQGRTGSEAILPGDLRLRVSYKSLIAGAEPEIDAPVYIPGPPFAPSDTISRTGSGWIFTCRPLAPGEDPDPIWQNPLAAVLTVPPDAVLDLRELGSTEIDFSRMA